MHKVLIAAFLFTTLLTNGQSEFPYKRSKKDIIIFPVAIASYITGNYLRQENDHNLTVEEISLLDRNDVNRFDRNATYFWNRSADGFSNTVFKIIPLTPMALAVPQLKNKKWNNTATLGLMYVEVFFLTKGITDITKSMAGRIRPYLYNTELTVDERFQAQGKDAPIANTSFFSGHSSSTFAFAVFLSKTYTDIYGKGTWSKIIWGTSLTLASATAYSRVAAGEHFPTDVIVGAVVGSAVGYAIPVLHKIYPEKAEISVLPGYFHIAYKF